MKNETKNLIAAGLAGALIVLIFVTVYRVRDQRADINDRETLAGIESQLLDALGRNRDLEKRIDIAGERIQELEAISAAERKTTIRLEESDNRSRAGLERIESILVDGHDIIDELIRFFEDYED